MKLYRTDHGTLIQPAGEGTDRAIRLAEGRDLGELLASASPADLAREWFESATKVGPSARGVIRAPIGEGQEIWAAGVTWYRSRDARVEESREAGGADFYDRVYVAERPELFFKGTARRAAGPGEPIRIRRDSRWNVPEPELVLVVTRDARIVGYTIGNDVSSRDIEGENPLYLPQAKVYDRSAALGPCIVLRDTPLPSETRIQLRVERSGDVAFQGEVTLAGMKRDPRELVEYLFRDQTHPRGVFLMTGTGIVPDREFTLAPGDQVEIEIDGIGVLRNVVERLGDRPPEADR